MGCVFSKQQWGKEKSSDAPKTREHSEDAEILSLAEIGKMGSHSFNERNFKENRSCNVCRQTADGNAVQCRECTTTAHIESEEKASGSVASLDLPPSQSKINVPPTTDRVEIVMERLMDSQFDFDLTYITERIISVLYLPDLDNQRYSSNLNEVAAMLNSKHQDKFLLLNLSERRHDICRLNPKVEEFGWPDLHAPPLDKICGMCKTIENWLHSDPHNVVVLHCKGNKGKTGVVVAAYMHYSKISAGADQVLSTVAMRKFCEDKISTSSLQPSQNRYIYYFSGLLSSKIKMNSSPLVLHQILIPTLHNYQPEGDCTLFLKIYQSLKLVYSSSKFDFQGSSHKMCVNLEPALLLKGDILVKCYHWNASSCKSECVFRVQFHTCSLHENQLVFGKRELDHACTDDRFPVDATVELLFSSKQRAEGDVQGIVQGLCSENGPADAIVRWDSYEHVNLHHEDSVEDISHTRGPLDGSLYAQVKKRRQTPGSSPKICPSPRRTTARSPINCTSSLQPASKSKDVDPSSASPCNSSGKKDKREKDELRNRHRETAILDDGENSPVRPDPPQVFHSRPSSQTHSFCDPDVTKPQTLQPKHHTLPCSRTAPMMFRDMYASQTDVLWERAHCPKHPCQETSRHLYCSPPQPATNSPRPHAQTTRAQTLPPQMSLFYSGEACPLLHCSSHSQGYTPISSPPTNQQLLPRPYRELRYSSPPPTSCSCRDCFRLHEDVALHSLGRRELETLPWFREAEFGVRRDGPTNWRDGMETYQEGMQESEYWRRRKLMSSLSSSHEHFHTISSPDPAMFPEYFPSISSFPSSQSSGYHSNHLPCPCSPQVIRESPGYPSISQSLSSSPIALITPSLKQANHSAECLNDGSNMPEKSQIGAFSTSTVNRPSAAGCQQKVKVPEIEILLGSQSSVVSTINETEEILDDTSIKTKTSYPTSSNNSTRLSKEVESVMVQTEEPKRQSFPTSPSPKPPLCPSERSSASEFSHEFNLNESKNPISDYNEESSISDLSVSSPDLDGSVTPSFPIASSNYPLLTVPHVPYTGYTAVTIPASFPLPPLPEKHLSPPLQNGSSASSLMIKSKPLNVSFSSITNELPLASSCKVMLSSGLDEPENHLSSTFVQDSSKYWYKPGISRDQAIAVLKDKEPGCFLIRDSNSFQGAYGLALKVSSLPAHSSNHGEVNNPQEQLVRHFLIESGAKGVKIKGCHNETYFGSLSALVYQHSITPVSLPCLLRIPDRDLVGELQESQSGTSTSTAAKLLRQGAACNVLYLNSVETESLTGPQAVAKATNRTLTQNPRPTPTVVHFKVSTQGITLTDNERRLFFRRHYPIHSVIFSCSDPMDQRWNDAGNASCKMFGFVARRSGRLGNVCHLFAELDSEQPATAIVNFINKVMLGPQQLRK